MEEKSLFILKNIKVKIKNRIILDNISINLKKNNITGVIGPSGSGKSTLLKVLSFLLTPYSGEITYKGIALKDYNPQKYRKTVSYVQQRPYLFPKTVRDNLLYGPKLWGIKYNEEELYALLDLVNLDPVFLDREVINLSEGEKQRINIARSLANKPEVLLLDEPTSALDLLSTEIIENLILKLKKQDLKIIVVTHNLEQTKRISDEVLVLNAGRILDHISIDEFLHSRSDEEIRLYFKKQSSNGGNQND